MFFVTVNLLKTLQPLTESEFVLLIKSIDESRQRLQYLLCGYVLIPDHWHALIWPHDPLTIGEVLKDIKYSSYCKINNKRENKGSNWQQFVF